MRNSIGTAYSTLTILRCAFEYELNNVLKLQEREEAEKIIGYFETRLKEIKEDEKECLRVQAS